MELKANTVLRESGEETEFSSRWEVLELLQSTRYRNSYLARSLRDDLTDHRVTLTVCRYEKRLLTNENYVENVRRRLLHEAEMLTLPLNFLPEPVDFFTCKNTQEKFGGKSGKMLRGIEPVLITETFAGEPLDVLIGREKRLPEERALRLGLRLCDLLIDLHRWRVLAYELRAEDILVDASDHDRIWVASCANYQKSDEGGVVVRDALVVPLTDFGFAAPEVEEGRASLDRRSDIYSLGALVLYLLTGIKARDHRTGEQPARSAIESFSAETQAFLGRCLSNGPKDRFPDAKAARSALSKAITRFQGSGALRASKKVRRALSPSSMSVRHSSTPAPYKPRSAIFDLVKIVLLPVLLPFIILRWLLLDVSNRRR